MEVGLIGLGRMGANMLQRWRAARHDCAVFDLDSSARERAQQTGARACATPAELVGALAAPRVLWLMVPAAQVDRVLGALAPSLGAGDIVVDGGNSHYRDAQRRAALLGARGAELVDVGVSGGIWGREIGYCQMVGGSREALTRIEPLLEALANGESERAAYLYCGRSGAGHFVKMIHNAIEYGVMQAYAEGFALLERARIDAGPRQPDADGARELRPADRPPGARSAAGRSVEESLPALTAELGDIAWLWQQGSVVRSWLLELAAHALARDPRLDAYAGEVADSGEGRWALEAATREGVPVPALAAALFARFDSRGGSALARRLLSALRHEFGGHEEPGPS